MNSTLAEIRKLNQGGANPPYAGTYVVYNFPDRDCSAKASAGELAIADGGLDKYKTEYIDPIAALAKEYSDTRIVFVYGMSLFMNVSADHMLTSTRTRRTGQPHHQHGRAKVLPGSGHL